MDLINKPVLNPPIGTLPDYLLLTVYSRTSMAQTSSGPWKFVQDMGSSSH